MATAPLITSYPQQLIFDDVQKFMGRVSERRPQNIICVGAHPDDAETGCGGTLAKLAAQGHWVTLLYLTRGEAGIRGGEKNTTAAVRSGESLRACHILQSGALFANQIDGETNADMERSRQFFELIAAAQPDIVFTHWPIDTHSDHRTAAQLVYQAWQWSSEKFPVVYYEVMTGVQTHHFQPTTFIDISATWRQKRSAIYAHRSQGPDRFYPYHEEMEKRRGEEANFERAEAFVVVREKLPKPYLPFTL
jgi:LmbE family N-acetylglucosaminyl deacetylase